MYCSRSTRLTCCDEKTHSLQCFYDQRPYLWESCNQSLWAFSGFSGCGQSAHSPASQPTTVQTLETNQPKAALAGDVTDQQPDGQTVFLKVTASSHSIQSVFMWNFSAVTCSALRPWKGTVFSHSASCWCSYIWIKSNYSSVLFLMLPGLCQSNLMKVHPHSPDYGDLAEFMNVKLNK